MYEDEIVDERKINGYIIKKLIFKSENAVIHIAEKIENSANHRFIIKEYKRPCIAKREADIANNIKNYSKRSILVGIPQEYNKDKEYMVSSYETNGIFLDKYLMEQESKNELKLETQLNILRKLLITLDYLHTEVAFKEYIGYLHTDLHPGNIFCESYCEEDGTFQSIKFIDLCNALEIFKDSNTGMKGNVDLGGVAGYYPYELIDNRQNEVYPALDLYSVAAIGARMYVGDKQVDEWFDEVEKKWREKEKHTIVETLHYTLLRCGLQFNPKYRFVSAKSMLKMVEDILGIIENQNNYYKLFELSYSVNVQIKDCVFNDLGCEKINFENAVSLLKNSLLVAHPNKHKCQYIFEALWKLYQENGKDSGVDKKYIAQLLSDGITSNNHLAMTDRAYELIDNWKMYEKYMESDERKLNVQNRIVNVYVDKCKYEEAYDMINENIEYLKKMKVLPGSKSVSLARAYSNAACFALMAKKGNEVAESWFESALNEFNNDGDENDNTKISRSHLLQYACYTKNKAIFKENIHKYLMCDDSDNRMKYFVQKCKDHELSINSANFVVLTYLKCVYTFEMECVNEEFCDCLVSILKEEVERYEHPMNLIYKYIVLILEGYASEKYEENIKEAREKSLNAVECGRISVHNPLNIIMLSTYQTKWEYNKAAGKEKENEILFEELYNKTERQKEIGHWESVYEELKKRKMNGRGLDQLLFYEVV